MAGARRIAGPVGRVAALGTVGAIVLGAYVAGQVDAPEPDDVVGGGREGLVASGALALPRDAVVTYESSRLVTARLDGEGAGDVRRAVTQVLDDGGLDVSRVAGGDGRRLLSWAGSTCGTVDIAAHPDGGWRATYARHPACTPTG